MSTNTESSSLDSSTKRVTFTFVDFSSSVCVSFIIICSIIESFIRIRGQIDMKFGGVPIEVFKRVALGVNSVKRQWIFNRSKYISFGNVFHSFSDVIDTFFFSLTFALTT